MSYCTGASPCSFQRQEVEPVQHARLNAVVVGAGVSAAGCNCALGDEDTTEDANVLIGSSDTDVYYHGLVWNDASNTRQLCRVDVLFIDKTGTITAKDFYVRVWTMTGGNLNANVASTGVVTGPSYGTGVFTAFTFASPYSLTAGTSYAITVNMEGSDASNYMRGMKHNGEGIANADWEQWSLNKNEAGNSVGNDPVMKLYWCQ